MNRPERPHKIAPPLATTPPGASSTLPRCWRGLPIGKTADRTKIVGLSILAAALFGPVARAADPSTLIVYSPHGREICERYEREFEAVRPDVDVQWFPLGASEALGRVRAEARNPQCDVWWGGPSDLFEQAAREGLLLPHRPSWTDLLAEHERAEDGSWCGQFGLPIVIGYNDRLLPADKVPRSFADLLDEKWRGQILLRYPMGSGTMKTFIGTVFIEEREKTDEEGAIEFLRRLDRNVKEYPASPTLLFQKLGRGEGLVTVWGLTDMIFQKREYGYDFGYVFPDGGAPEIVDCVAIVKSPRDPEPAKAFVEHVGSAAASIDIARDYFRIPLRTDLDPAALPDWLRELPRKFAAVPRDALAREGEEILALWDRDVKRRSSAQPGAITLSVAAAVLLAAIASRVRRSRTLRRHAAA